MIATDKSKEKYINYLIKELEIKEKNLSNIETIYIGGGTPSSIPLNLLEKLLNKLSQIVNLSILKEFSVEANPNDINDELLILFKKYHVNRISLGVQGVNETKLKILNRKHNLNIIRHAIDLINTYEFHHINIDYMFGLPNETVETVKKELDIITSFKIDHISCYSLILEEKTILYHQYLSKEFELLDDDLETDIYYFICDYLHSLNFKHYEISNFCIDEGYSYHNLTYWDNEEYEAIGANASNYVNGIRSTNINNLEKYYQGIDNKKLNYLEYNEVSFNENIENEIMLGLRKTSGINIEKFNKKFSTDFFKLYPVSQELINNKLLEYQNGYLFIPQNKLYISNEIILKFLS